MKTNIYEVDKDALTVLYILYINIEIPYHFTFLPHYHINGFNYPPIIVDELSKCKKENGRRLSPKEISNCLRIYEQAGLVVPVPYSGSVGYSITRKGVELMDLLEKDRTKKEVKQLEMEILHRVLYEPITKQQIDEILKRSF